VAERKRKQGSERRGGEGGKIKGGKMEDKDGKKEGRGKGGVRLCSLTKILALAHA